MFGALFTVASLLLGFVGAEIGHVPHAGHVGHMGNGAQAGHGGHAVGGPPGGVHASHAGHGPDLHVGGHDAGGHGGPFADLLQFGLPLLNVSSALAFLTWFGAAGYLMLQVAEAPAPVAVGVGAIAELAGGAFIALFLRKVMSGEREMDPSDYRWRARSRG